MPRIDWDTDKLKHYVRMKGWCPACQWRAERVQWQIRSRGDCRRTPLKYFTLCASKAIDVFMLERAGLLARSSSTGRHDHVFFCEQDLEEYAKIIELIGTNGFLGPLEGIILFEDDDDTKGRSLDDNKRVERLVRRKLKLKEQHEKLVSAFPFDVVNLDVCGTIFPPGKGRISPMIAALRRILDWQLRQDEHDGHACHGFTLLLTSSLDNGPVDRSAMEDLLNRMKQNLKYGEFRDAFEERWKHTEPDALFEQDFPSFFCLALPKVLIRDGLERGWDAAYRGIYLYRRVDAKSGATYSMMSSVTHFLRSKQSSSRTTLNKTAFEAQLDRYVQAASDVVKFSPAVVNEELNDEATLAGVTSDLEAIKNYRDEILQGLRAAG